MKVGISARVPVLAGVIVVAALATATLTLAATSNRPSSTPAVAAAEAEPATLVVPDVRRQAYVFAKGTLEGAGFAWKVRGAVRGYAANVVAAQTPLPGTRVLADGAPIVTLALSRNPSYRQEGVPENASPYPGRPARLPGAGVEKPAPARAAAAAPKRSAASNAAPKRARPSKPAPVRPAARKPAFLVPGAPKEPLDEITLLARAAQLEAWIATRPQRTPAAVERWLYQHNWIVAGARFGWSGGAEALRKLIAIDRDLQRLWGVGVLSEQLARRTLANVQARPR